MEGNEFEIESEVRDIKRPGAALGGANTRPVAMKPGEDASGDASQNGSPTLCEREKCCCRCIHADESVCDIAGEVACGDYALNCKDYKVEASEECHFAVDMDWLLSLMCDKWLIKLRDVVEYRIKGEEYFRNPECKISCGCMRYIIVCIDEELKWRREHGIQVEY